MPPPSVHPYNAPGGGGPGGNRRDARRPAAERSQKDKATMDIDWLPTSSTIKAWKVYMSHVVNDFLGVPIDAVAFLKPCWDESSRNEQFLLEDSEIALSNLENRIHLHSIVGYLSNLGGLYLSRLLCQQKGHLCSTKTHGGVGVAQ